jgi:ribonucleoside-diphosphate reductase alpha chain
VPNALKRLGYNDKETKEIEEYITGTKTLSNCPHLSAQKLTKIGLDSGIIKRLEDSFSDVFDIRSAFSPTILGENTCKKVLGMSQENYDDPFFDVLSHIGLSSDEIDTANDYVFGYNMIEGAPGLKQEHLAVFDCATPCGKYGKRSIDWKAHVMMMAAAQPFISGAISKTINMPSNSTVSEIRDAYDLSHSTMNKACAVYRDCSKLSQPLMNQLVDSNAMDEDEEVEELLVTKMVEEVVNVLPLPETEAKPVAQSIVNYIATRRQLPNKKKGDNIKARIGGHSVRLITGEYPDGALGEIILVTSKEGAAWRAMLNQFAIAVSIGLQHGVPLEAFVKVFTFQKFEPSGMVEGGSGRVKMTSSLVDWIFRELAIEYAGRDDLAHVAVEESDFDPYSISKPEMSDVGLVRNQGEKREVQYTLDSVSNLEDIDMRERRIARERGYTGDICASCGSSQMRRNGTCLKCDACGETTGCS